MATVGEAKTSKPRVLIVDDHPLVRRGLAIVLQAVGCCEIVGEAVDGVEAVQMTERLRPDVVLMDISMPRLNGVEATRRIKAEMPEVHVVGLSFHTDLHTRRMMLQAGAAACVRKDTQPDELWNTIRAVLGINNDQADAPA